MYLSTGNALQLKIFELLKISAVVIAAGYAAALEAASVERVFRAERHSRGDTNVRVQQPIDEASWIWAKGHDVWGGAVFSETRTDPATLAKVPQSFFRFRKDFTATDEPLGITGVRITGVRP